MNELITINYENEIDLTMLARSAYRAILRSIETTETLPEDSAAEQPLSKGDQRKARLDGLSQVHFLLKQGTEKFGDDDGWADASIVTQWIRRAKPDFDLRNFGYHKMIELFEDFPKKYEVRRQNADRNGGKVYYRRR